MFPLLYWRKLGLDAGFELDDRFGGEDGLFGDGFGFGSGRRDATNLDVDVGLEKDSNPELEVKSINKTICMYKQPATYLLVLLQIVPRSLNFNKLACPTVFLPEKQIR